MTTNNSFLCSFILSILKTSQSQMYVDEQLTSKKIRLFGLILAQKIHYNVSD
jgi:hypothetical protein